MINMYDIPLDDPTVWDMICEGNVIGLFQIESQLGQAWVQKIQPRNIEELSAVIALVRPGCLKAMEEDENGNLKSLTQHYADRKSGKDKIPEIHPVVDKILAPNMGILIYQENTLDIAKECAGFNLVEADTLRRAASKKLADLMSEVKSNFIKKAKEKDVISEQLAAKLFSWIEKSNRYSFNKTCSYDTAVLTIDNGIQTLESVSIGDYISSPSGWTKILNKYDHGKQQLVEVLLQNGYTIKCTIDHKFWSGKQWDKSDFCMRPLYVILGEGMMIDTDAEFFGPQDIINVQHFGLSQTYDLEVDNQNHIYYANGIATSNSHSISYAINAYYSAYIKHYYPKEFYTSWLHYGLQSQEPFEEIARIANDAKLHDFDVNLPNIIHHNKNFKIIDGEIRFGLLAVKSIGEAQIEKLKEAINSAPPNPTWEQILFFISTKVSSTCFKHLIKVGAITAKKSRKEMLREYDIWTQLSKKEQDGIINIYNGKTGLSSLFRDGARIKSQGGVCANRKRAEMMMGFAEALDNPTYSLEDTPKWIADQEKELLGIYLTCAPVDECDTFEANCTCKEFVNNYKADHYILGVSVTDIREIKVKNGKSIGKKMAYLSIGDASGIIGNVVAFPGEYERFAGLLEKDSNVLIAGIRDKKNPNTLVVQQVKGI